MVAVEARRDSELRRIEGFQRLGTAAWEGGDGRVEAERRVAH